MYKISLINMPFSSLSLPSIALTQLASVCDQNFGDEVRSRILYLSHDFAHYLGDEQLYPLMNSSQSANSGLGDWFFRQIAFPDEPDNTQQYFQRYYPQQTQELEAVKGKILAKRIGLKRFMQRLITKYKLKDENMVGMTTMFSQSIASFAMARLIKEANSKVVTILGGANCETPMGKELAKHVEPLDFVCSGPGLVSFPKLIQNQMDGKLEECHQIAGIYSKENYQSDFLQGPNSIGEELPIDVPVPLNYEPFLQTLEKSFRGKVEPNLNFETSRGCWWGERSHCTFCGLNGGSMAYRAMPSAAALDLFNHLAYSYGDRCSLFSSVDNILPREYLSDVLPQFQAPDGVKFFYEVKADLKEHEMKILSDAAVTEIQPGIESLNTSTLRLMKKGTTAFQNVTFLKNCVTYGINPAWNLLIGFPGEREDVYEKYLADIPSLAHLPPPGGAFPVRFDRYSPYFTGAKEYGLNLSPYDFYRFSYPFDDEIITNIAYYFEDLNYNAKYLTSMLAWSGRLTEAVAEWQALWEEGVERPELILCQIGDDYVVRDTRSGELQEHELTPLQVSILEFLYNKGWKIRNIAKNVNADEAAVGQQVSKLLDLGLLFEENQRYSSLVLESDRASKIQAMDLTQQHTEPSSLTSLLPVMH